MNKFVKSLLVAGSVAALAACSSSNNDAAGNGANNGQTFGGYSVEDLQQRYNTVYFGFDKFNIEGEYVQILDAHAAYLNATPASKVVVEGVNVVKRHQKPNPMRGVEGGIVSKEMPLDISNVAILNPETNKADRVGVKLIENEGKVKRVRFFKSNGSVIGA